jgi:hypothetical protein
LGVPKEDSEKRSLEQPEDQLTGGQIQSKICYDEITNNAPNFLEGVLDTKIVAQIDHENNTT